MNILGGLKWAHRVRPELAGAVTIYTSSSTPSLSAAPRQKAPGEQTHSELRPPPNAKLIHSNDCSFPSGQQLTFQQLEKFVNNYLSTMVLHWQKTTTVGGGDMPCHRLQSNSGARRSLQSESSSSCWRAASSWPPLAMLVCVHTGNLGERFSWILRPFQTPSVKTNEVLTKVKWIHFNLSQPRTSLEVQWLRLCFHFGVRGLIPGWGTKIPHATWCGQKLVKIKKN